MRLDKGSPTGRLVGARGLTRAFIEPRRGVATVDELLTGLHEPRTTHLAPLETFLPRPVLARAYERAIDSGLLWHEFGESHLILSR